MKTWVRRSLNAGALTAGALLVTGTAAQAGGQMASTDNIGALNGTQAYAPIQVPVDVCGVAVAALGTAAAECEGGAAAVLDPEWTYSSYEERMVSGDNVGLLNGTQLYAPIQAPVNLCGIGVAIGGLAGAECDGGAGASHGDRDRDRDHRGKHRSDCDDEGYSRHAKDRHRGYDRDCDDRGGRHHHREADSIQTVPAGGPLGALPIVGGSAGGLGSLPVVGDLLGAAGGLGGGGPVQEGGFRAGPSGPTMLSQGNIGILNGTQVQAPVQVPVNVCGISVAVLGTAGATCDGGAVARLN